MRRLLNMNEIEERILTNQHVIMDFLSGGCDKTGLFLAMNITSEILFPIEQPTIAEQTKDTKCEVKK